MLLSSSTPFQPPSLFSSSPPHTPPLPTLFLLLQSPHPLHPNAPVPYSFPLLSTLLLLLPIPLIPLLLHSKPSSSISLSSPQSSPSQFPPSRSPSSPSSLQSEEKPKKKKSKEKSSATLSEGGKIASASSSSTDNNKADVEPEAPNDEWVSKGEREIEGAMESA